MNYVAEHKAFLLYLFTNRLSPGQIALWNALFGLCNMTGWKREFTVPMETLIACTGLSQTAVLKNRSVLKEMGLIDFRTNGNMPAIYTVKSVKQLQDAQTEPGEEQDAPQSIPQSVPQSVPQSAPLYKPNETKPNKTKQGAQAVRFAEHVRMTQEEMDRLAQEFGQEGAGQMVELLNAYKGASGKTYRSDYMAIRSWVVRRWQEERGAVRTLMRQAPASYDTQQDFFYGWDGPAAGEGEAERT